MEYDIVGERGGRFAQVRTTTTVETLVDHLLDQAATERDPQLPLDLSPPT